MYERISLKRVGEKGADLTLEMYRICKFIIKKRREWVQKHSTLVIRLINIGV